MKKYAIFLPNARYYLCGTGTTYNQNEAQLFPTREAAEQKRDNLNSTWLENAVIVENHSLSWNLVSDGLPNYGKDNPYPCVEVVLQCRSGSERSLSNATPPIQKVARAELRFFGGDSSRPYWRDQDGKVLENDSWFVTHWKEYAELPDPVSQPATPFDN